MKAGLLNPRVGDKVIDTWFSEWGIGTVVGVLKTRVKICFGSEIKSYDYPHTQFLHKLKRSK